MISYGFVKELDTTFEDVCELLPGELQKEGFGVLTKIPIHEKLKEKIGVDFRKYMIFGACHPPSAHKALTVEENIGLMLPCNVIIYEKDGKTVLSVIRPTVAMQMIENNELLPVANDIEEKLKRIFDSF
jgi:uncharacterized protein (DUF302 family)